MEVLRRNKHSPIDDKCFYREMMELLQNRDPDFIENDDIYYYAFNGFNVMLFLYDTDSSLEIYDRDQDLYIILINNGLIVHTWQAFYDRNVVTDLPEQFECFSYECSDELTVLESTVGDIFRLQPIVKSARN
jgi:hypothetical protein